MEWEFTCLPALLFTHCASLGMSLIFFLFHALGTLVVISQDSWEGEKSSRETAPSTVAGTSQGHSQWHSQWQFPFKERTLNSVPS